MIVSGDIRFTPSTQPTVIGDRVQLKLTNAIALALSEYQGLNSSISIIPIPNTRTPKRDLLAKLPALAAVLNFTVKLLRVTLPPTNPTKEITTKINPINISGFSICCTGLFICCSIGIFFLLCYIAS